MTKVHIGSEVVEKVVDKYMKPSFIYIPLVDKVEREYKMMVKEGDYVYKGSIIGVCESINFPIHSSISGYVRGIKKVTLPNNKEVESVIIENDYKEKCKRSRKKTLDNYTKEDFINDLRLHGIVGLGGSGFPTFMKYNLDNPKYLIVNAVECEPYLSCDKVLIDEYTEEILEGIDNILDIMKIDKAYIAIKKTSVKQINMLKKYISTYPNISLSLVDDIYPSGWERLVIKNTLGIEYDKYPSEKGIIVSNVSTIKSIYDMLKYDYPLTERIITVTGPGIKNHTNIKVKIGTKFSDIIDEIGGYQDIRKPIFVMGGPMMGTSLSTDEVIITKEVSAVMVVSDNKEEVLPCIKCGKCIEVCPSKIMPVLIMKNVNNKNNLKHLEVNKCMECGLCSYICPSKIEVREYVKTAKEKVNRK